MQEKREIVDALVKQFDDQLHEEVAVRGLPEEKVYQDFCFDGEPLLRLDDHVAQAYKRKRSELGPEDWTDFEKGGRGSDGPAGKCAEYLMWLQCTQY
ncbi:MAG: hypothetical protein M1826_004488 [Phylliscum demangeonii]|nr:MAG: hypothetical protein M1826_004488 [Phylliscum demangeonii]